MPAIIRVGLLRLMLVEAAVVDIVVDIAVGIVDRVAVDIVAGTADRIAVGIVDRVVVDIVADTAPTFHFEVGVPTHLGVGTVDIVDYIGLYIVLETPVEFPLVVYGIHLVLGISLMFLEIHQCLL